MCLISNNVPNGLKKRGVFYERFLHIQFFSNLENIDPDRLIATLLGCIHRRLSDSQ